MSYEIINGDCLVELPKLAARGITVDAVITDPPYGRKHRRGRCGDRGKGVTLGTKGIAGDDKPFDPRHLLDFPNVILWGANFYADKLPPGRWLIWDKQEHGGSGDFSEAEIAWHSKGEAIKFFRHMWLGVQRASEVGEPRLHDTQKPVALMLWCIEQAKLAPGSIIVDPYCGSGPLLVAATIAGFDCIGIDIDPHNCAVAEARAKRASGIGATIPKRVRADRPAPLFDTEASQGLAV